MRGVLLSRNWLTFRSFSVVGVVPPAKWRLVSGAFSGLVSLSRVWSLAVWSVAYPWPIRGQTRGSCSHGEERCVCAEVCGGWAEVSGASVALAGGFPRNLVCGERVRDVSDD